jgi:hypothetical protein
MLWLSEWMIIMLMSLIPISPTRCCNHVTSFGLLVDALYSTLVDDNVIVGCLELQVIGLSMSWKVKPIIDFLLVHPLNLNKCILNEKGWGSPLCTKSQSLVSVSNI